MTRSLWLLRDSPFALWSWLSTNQFVAVLFLGVVNMLEILLGIVTEFLFYLLSYFACFFYNGIFHVKAPLTLQAYR